ncbi:hypothetical protein YC2023_051319 [Brassica napus]
MALRKHPKQPENPIGILFYAPYLSAARLRVKTAEFGPEKLASLFNALYGFWAFPKWSYGRPRLRVKTAAFGAEKLPRLFTALYGFWAFPKWCYGRRSSSRFKSYEVSMFTLALSQKIK